MKNFKIEGILPALITPFNEDNKTINIESTKNIIDLHISQGAGGFYILGGTGEGIVMSRENREVMTETVINHIGGKVPVIVHVGAKNMEETIELAKHAEKMGADAIASMPPSFFDYLDEDLYNFYKTLAASVNLPVIIYYHPAAQSNMSAELISRIFTIDNVTGVKWSSDNYYEMIRLKDMTHGEMNIINGPDELLLLGLSSGADAGVGATYNVMLPEYVKLYNYFKSGEMSKALECQMRVIKVIDAILPTTVVPSLKYMANMMGLNVGTGSYPMNQFEDASVRAQLESALKKAGWPFC